jgi:hypothetical protein
LLRPRKAFAGATITRFLEGADFLKGLIFWGLSDPSPDQAGLERAKGIEPSYAAWEAAVLPLNYAREIISKIKYFFIP